MAIIEKVKNNKKRVIAFTALSITVVLVLCAFTSTRGSAETSAETVYRESTVQRGDITVGVSETASATLKTNPLSFEAAGEIEEVYVKAGQRVSKGDQIASLSPDKLNETLDGLRSDYEEAALKLSEARLAQQKGELDANSTYKSTVNKSETADSTYDMTIEKLELAVEKAEKKVKDLKDEIYTYTRMLNDLSSYDEYYDAYLTAKENYDYAQDHVDEVKQQISDYIKAQGGSSYENDYEYQRLQENLATAQNELRIAEAIYKGRESSYNSTYASGLTDEDAIKKARDQALSDLDDAEASLREAKYNLEVQSSQAALTKDDNTSRAEIAGTTYQMELQSLANSVSSKQIALDNIQDQIDKYTALLDKLVITSPCDGVVNSISRSAGDSVQAAETVATVSDSNNVFVYLTVTQDDITGVTLGQDCSVLMDAFESAAFDGVVDGITTTPARNASGSASYSVTVKLLGDTSQIYEGMTGTATLITKQKKDVIYVTSRTIYSKDGASYVKVKHPDGTIEEVKVTTGFSDGRNVEIVSGLEEGQTVLIESQVVAQS